MRATDGGKYGYSASETREIVFTKSYCRGDVSPRCVLGHVSEMTSNDGIIFDDTE